MNLKQRILASILVIILALSLSGCGNKEKEKDTEKTKEPQTEEQILEDRRETVVKAMEDMLTVLWRSEADVMNIVKDRLYQGIPYTEGSGSGFSFLDYVSEKDENGIYTITGLIDKLLSGDVARLGCDSADAMSWAWGSVSSSISFTDVGSMTEKNGCLKVGEYEYNGELFSQTKDVCEDNGADVMYKAYEKLQKGDGLVVVGEESKVMMVTEIQVTKSESYVKTICQTDEYFVQEKSYHDKELEEDIYYCGGTEEKKYTFEQLYQGGYLPITCKELVDASPLADAQVTDSEKEAVVDNILSGVFSSPYRISDVKITISDMEGSVLQEVICYGTEDEMKAFDLSRIQSDTERPVIWGEIDVEALQKGEFRCTHTCRIATGESIVVRDFKFAKK